MPELHKFNIITRPSSKEYREGYVNINWDPEPSIPPAVWDAMEKLAEDTDRINKIPPSPEPEPKSGATQAPDQQGS